MREMMEGYSIVEYKWIILGRIAALGLTLMTGFVLVYMVTIPGRPASADKVVPVRHGTAQLRSAPVKSAAAKRDEAIKSAVLKWMRENSDMPDEMLSKIYDAARNSGNTDLVLAVCAVESNFNPMARSDKGAIGLMGVMPKVWLSELKAGGIVKRRRDLYTIGKNIASGAYVLDTYVRRTNDIEEALTRYVGGDPAYPQKVFHELGEIYMARRSALIDPVTSS